MEFLQYYWWIIISVLAGLLVFLLFVQGGQSLLYRIGKNEDEKDLIINVLGRKWEFTFTTLVVFGGAFFAAFPLFYATSFGGAYAVWILLLFTFVVQAVSFEFRTKAGNWLGKRCYETFLIINGVLAPILIGAAVSTFFTGSPFSIGEKMNVRWDTPFRGLDALFVFTNYLMAFTVFFLSRILGLLFFINAIGDGPIRDRSRKTLKSQFLFFLLSFSVFLVIIFTGKGYAVDPEGHVELVRFKYARNLIEMPLNTILFLTGIGGIIFGSLKSVFHKTWRKGIWFAGTGTVIGIAALFLIAGFNGTAFYPSSTDIQSSLTVQNASSSEYTLKTMAYVSIVIPFVLSYIWYAWKALTKKPITTSELEKEEHKY